MPSWNNPDPMSRSLQQTHEYPHSVVNVWNALTKPELMGLWLMNFDNDEGEMTADFQPRVGTSYRLDAKKGRGWRGYVVGDVVDVDPKKLLVITWAHSKKQDKSPIRIEFALQSTEAGTRLTMVQSGYARGVGGWFAMKMGAMGWRKMLGKSIKPVLEGTVPR
jgi:uncharacterized protein YndB with AHSA1/START domain